MNPIINFLNKIFSFFVKTVEAIQTSRYQKAKKIAEEYKTRYKLNNN